jgi:hypothetical protein
MQELPMRARMAGRPRSIAGRVRIVRPERLIGAFLAGLLCVAGCGDKQAGGISRLNPRGVPFLEGVPVPGGFDLVTRFTEDYESGGQRMARHTYQGHADPAAVRTFYREQMPLVGWTRVSDQNVQGTVTIRFEKKTEDCTVEIRPTGLFNRTTIQVVVKPFSRTNSEAPRRNMP